ncbi:family 78 glycoside hydrolase catalytic domain [Streptomyces shenzhenensis]|uniref:family 78 glycoside hydrolase catalytic domain n=1 Tax=Streptomyces shenzhenensis TaxID=943815 RepID=UPI0015F076B4|nr:family 78 glycoside hydrolase catalytic domain [Streptomyces shenzhenensis]
MRHHWTAQVVSPRLSVPAEGAAPAALLRTEFTARAAVRSARLLVTALGVYELELNGTVVGDHVLAPGWTSYRHRHRYQSFDVTSLVREGRNAWSAHLADGWYLYEGEEYDARQERAGFSEAGFDDSAWQPAEIIDFDTAALFPADSPPVRRTEHLAPVAVTTSPTGRTIVDFGQNLVGRLRIRVRGEAGRTITLRHAEVLEDGELCTRTLRKATATDRYVLRGDPAGEKWEPRFTVHGFRYAEVEGWPGDLDPADVTAVVLHSDLRRTGWFSCSDASLNRLHDNVVWGMRGNFVDVPTDCPQRDERLGWSGDLQVFAPTAAFLYDVRDFLRSWLRDLAADQGDDEQRVPPLFTPAIPVIKPIDVPPGNPPTAGWCDASVIVPWVLYERYGDTEVLRAQYSSMRAWVDALDRFTGPARTSGEGFQFGDWLDPTAPADDPGRAMTSPALVATAYFAHSARLLARTAEVLDHGDDAAHYHALADEVRDAFLARFRTDGGHLKEETQTAYALALCFRLLEDDADRAEAGRRLADLVAEGGHRIGTGFLGTHLVCDALAETGHLDTAYRLLTQRSCPSWLYQVDMGATTVWERWDSLLPDGSVNPGEMTSFNHYALGAIGDWMHRTVAGLAPDGPGYRRLLVRPRPGGGLTWARAEHDTPYGRAEAGWRQEGDTLHVDVVVPPGTAALVDLPGTEPVEAGPGRHTFRTPFATSTATSTR